MPPLLTVHHPRTLEGVLVRLALQADGAALLARVEVLRPGDTADIWRGGQALSLDLNLPDDPGLADALRAQLADAGVRGEDWLPATVRPGARSALEAFLHTVALVPEDRPSDGRRLALAYAGDDPDALVRAVPRVLDGPLERVEVAPAEDGASPTFRCLLLLPRAARGPGRGFRWDDWLAWQNRRDVRLVARLPGEAGPQVFVEYGWRYPLNELPLVYPNTRRAHTIVLWRDGGTRWALLRPVGERPVAAAGPFELRLEPAGEPEVGRLVDATPPVVPVRLRPVGGDRAARVAYLERRAEGLRVGLQAVERERLALLGRPAWRGYWVLRFRQDAAPAEASEAYRRFLAAAWGQQDRWDYAYHDLGPAGGWHVVRSREALPEARVPLGLADAVYYHPAGWGDGPALFLRHDCEPDPPLSSEQADRLAAGFRAPIDAAGVDPRGCLVLLDPAEVGIRASILLMPADGGSVAARVELLNVEYPDALEQARTQAHAAAVARLAESDAAVTAQIAALEERLLAETDARLRDLRADWDGVATGLAERRRQVEQLAERCGVFDLLGRDFARDWGEFLAFVSRANAELVAAKLHARDDLDRAVAAWDAARDAARRADEETADLLAPLEAATAAWLDDARARHERARVRYDAVVAREAAAREEFARLTADCDRWLREADESRQRVEAGDGELTRRVEAARRMQRAAEAALGNLRTARGEFEAILLRLRATSTQGRALLGELARHHDGLPGVAVACREELRRATAIREQVEATCAATEREVAGVASQLSEQERAAREAADRLTTLQGDLTTRSRDAAQLVFAGQEALGHLRRARREFGALVERLRAAHAEAEATRADLAELPAQVDLARERLTALGAAIAQTAGDQDREARRLDQDVAEAERLARAAATEAARLRSREEELRRALARSRGEVEQLGELSARVRDLEAEVGHADRAALEQGRLLGECVAAVRERVGQQRRRVDDDLGRLLAEADELADRLTLLAEADRRLEHPRAAAALGRYAAPPAEADARLHGRPTDGGTP